MELLAAFYGIKSFTKNLRDCGILLRLDNKTAIACITQKGSIQYPKLNTITRAIWQWYEDRNIQVLASYIPSKENAQADTESRSLAIETEYELNNKVFIQLCKTFGKRNIGLFASKLNAKCKKYVSWGPDPNLSHVDAFTFKWNLFFYAFPPFCLVSKTLRKIFNDKEEIYCYLLLGPGTLFITVFHWWPGNYPEIDDKTRGGCTCHDIIT